MIKHFKRYLSFILLVASASAMAVPVTIEFTATVNETYDPDGVITGIYPIGTEITGTYTFDTDMPATFDDPSYLFTEYRDANPTDPATGFTFKVGYANFAPDYTVHTDKTIFVDDDMMPFDASTGTWDNFVMTQFGQGQLGGETIMHAALELMDHSGIAFTGRGLNDVLQVIDNLTERRFFFGGQKENWMGTMVWFDVYADVTSIKVIGGPEPAPSACAPVDKTKMYYEAIVTSISDPASLVGQAIKKGDQILGMYSMNPDTAYTDFDASYRKYYGMDSINGFAMDILGGTVDTRNKGTLVFSFVNNDINTGHDRLTTEMYDASIDLGNGLFIEGIWLEAIDPTGKAIDSKILGEVDPSDVNKWDIMNMRIKTRDSNNHYVWIDMEITGFEQDESVIADTWTKPGKLSPASGKLYMGQRYEANLVLPPEAPLATSYVAMINNRDGTFGVYCSNTRALSGEQVISCAGMSHYLRTDYNYMNLRVTFDDGSFQNHKARYILIE